jgi:hypothetical protein
MMESQTAQHKTFEREHNEQKERQEEQMPASGGLQVSVEELISARDPNRGTRRL